MIIAIWIIAALLIGSFALLAWALAALIGTDVSAWLSQVEPWLQRAPFGGWLEGWFPEWLTTVSWLLEALKASLAWLGAAGPVLVWAAFGVIAALTVLGAALLSLLVALIRRNVPGKPQPVVAA